MLAPPAPVYGLVLAGGLSSRLGRDKGLIPWHGKPRRLYLQDMFKQVGIRPFLSLRPGQNLDISADVTVISDQYGPIGPAGALLSAMDACPECAWLVIACDLPLINPDFLRFLMACRDPEALFTGCANDFGLEPLAAIWEPAARQILADSIRKEEYGLRSMMQGRQMRLLTPPTPNVLLNVNNRHDFELICHILDIFNNNYPL